MEYTSIKNQVARGSFWLFGANFISRGITFLSTLVLARLLTPEAFGVIGYGFLIVGAIGLIREMGFNSALIYQKRKINEAASAAILFIFCWSTFLYFLVVLLAPLAATFFREPRLVQLLRVLTLSLILNSLASVPMSLLEKEIRFKKRVIPELINLSAYGVITVIFAWLQFDYWAFVIGVLVADICQLIAAFILSPVKIRLKVDWKILRELFGFGRSVMSLGILNFLIRNIDDFFIGRMLGTVPMGIYQFSYRIANIPATNITNVLGKVLYPGFTKIAHNINRLRNAFLQSFEYVTFITIPVTLYIILITPDVIHHFFPKWIDAIVPIQLIAYFGGVRSIGSGTGSIFLAIGKPNRLIPISLTQVLFLTAFLYPVIHFWGLIGVCVLVNLSITISFVWSFLLIRKFVEISLISVSRILFIPLLFSIILMMLLSTGWLENLSDWQYYLIVLKGIGFPVLFILFSFIFSETLGNLARDLLKRE